MKNLKETSAKPFIKWVGGKTQLLEEVEALISDRYWVSLADIQNRKLFLIL